MLSPLESRILDKNSECLGVPINVLMENAGRELAKVVDTFATGKILFICGSGNNGGDGYAASQFLKTKADYCHFREPKSDLCIETSKKVFSQRYSPELMTNYDTIVDCVLGTGIEGALKQPYVDFIDTLNSLKKNVISCDVPSGLGTDHSVIANITVTFHEKKIGMSEQNCGRIIVSDIGIPEEAKTHLNKGDFLRYPIPKDDSHKGQNGRLIIVGGGPFVGAPISAALAATRIGTDLVTIFTPKRSFIPIASHSTAYIVKELSSDNLCMEDVNTILNACKSADALLIGPGLGCEGTTVAEATRAIVESAEIPIVIDADAITHVAGFETLYNNVVFTPHKRELSRLIGQDEPSDEVIQRLCDNGTVILRKGRIDRIYNGTEIRYNQSGCSGMTVGGTGDVLAGIVAGLLSKGMSNFDSACLGAYICGLSGRMAFDEHSYGMNSEDVIAHIGHVLKEGLE